MKKRIWALLLSCCMLFGFTACGGSEAESEVNNVNLMGRINEDLIYFASDVDFELNSTVSDVDFKVYGQSIYYPKEQSIVTYSVSDEAVAADVYSWADAPGEWSFERVSYGKAGDVYALVGVGAGTASAGVQYLCRFNADRNLVFAQELTKYYENGETFSGSDRLEVGDDGRIYLSNTGALLVFEADGTYADKVSFGSVKDVWVKDLQSSADRKLYVLYEDKSNQEQYVAEIDTEKCAVTALQQTIALTGIGTTEKEGQILGFNGATVYTYDRTNLNLTELFHWTECSVGGAAVYMAKELSDGRIFTAGNPTWGGVENYLIKSMQVGSAEATETGKIDIHLAELISASGELQGAVANFNRSNEKYNIVIDVYGKDDRDEGIALLEAQIDAGNGPDIVSMKFGKVRSMVEDMYLEDLSLYLAGSEVLSEGSFLEIALEEYNVDGILAAIPQRLTMQTVIGNSNLVGEEAGWTMEEYLDFVEQQGGESIFPDGTHCRNILWPLIRLNEEFFVDRESNTCHFDNDIFRRFVEIGANYPLDYDRIERPTESHYTLLRDGSAVLTSAGIFDFISLQKYEITLGGAMNCIGFPVEEGIGVWASTEDAFGIAAMSEHKDVAWEFLEYFLQKGSTDTRSTYFPTYRPNLEKMAENYLSLTNPGYFTFTKGGEKHDFHAPTIEEIEEYLLLLENAKIGTADVWLVNLILEELDHYYNGEKTMEELLETLEARGAKYLEESQ